MYSCTNWLYLLVGTLYCYCYCCERICNMLQYSDPAWILQSAQDQQRFWLAAFLAVPRFACQRSRCRGLSACRYNRVGAGGPLIAASLPDIPGPHRGQSKQRLWRGLLTRRFEKNESQMQRGGCTHQWKPCVLTPYTIFYRPCV